MTHALFAEENEKFILQYNTNIFLTDDLATLYNFFAGNDTQIQTNENESEYEDFKTFIKDVFSIEEIINDIEVDNMNPNDETAILDKIRIGFEQKVRVIINRVIEKFENKIKIFILTKILKNPRVKAKLDNVAKAKKIAKALEKLGYSCCDDIELQTALTNANYSEVVKTVVKTELCNTQDKDIAKDIRVEKISQKGVSISGIVFVNNDDYFDLIVHGKDNNFNVILEKNNNKFVINVNANTLALTIKNNLPNNTKPLRLLSCSNLESAKELSLALGRDIVATNGIVTLYKSGAVTSTSKWVLLSGCVQSDVNTSNWKKTGNKEEFVVLGSPQIEQKSTDYDLAKEAIKLRKSRINTIGKDLRNVAVIEYEDNNERKILAMFSEPSIQKHAEEMLIDWIISQNITFDKIKRIHSELMYCSNKCKPLIESKLQNLESMTYTFELSEYNENKLQTMKGKEKSVFETYVKNIHLF